MNIKNVIAELRRFDRHAEADFVAALQAENAELKEKLLITRKYSYGDGYEGASIEFSGRIQELEAELSTLRESADKLLRAVMLRDGDPLEAAASLAGILVPAPSGVYANNIGDTVLGCPTEEGDAEWLAALREIAGGENGN